MLFYTLNLTQTYGLRGQVGGLGPPLGGPQDPSGFRSFSCQKFW